jgi:hypothetical protein
MNAEIRIEKLYKAKRVIINNNLYNDLLIISDFQFITT